MPKLKHLRLLQPDHYDQVAILLQPNLSIFNR